MTVSIKRSTFVKNADQAERGTIEITFKGETMIADCFFSTTGVWVYGFTGRYQQGAKAWDASVFFKGEAERNPAVSFGRDDRSAKFNKQHMIYWNPK